MRKRVFSVISPFLLALIEVRAWILAQEGEPQPMSQTQIFELTLLPGKGRDGLLEIFRDLGIEDFVESAGDVDLDDSDWQEGLDAWASGKDAPFLLYREEESAFAELLHQLRLRLGDEVKTSVKAIRSDLWMEAWEPDFEFLETKRFFIGHEDLASPSDKIRIKLKSAEVFGSGQHATTQALVRLMEQSEQSKESHVSFLDVGTGTGVLCLVAHHLGYQRLMGTDIEDTAIANAKSNSELNGIPIELLLGSLPPLNQKWQTIACNILPPTLTHLLAELAARLDANGDLYLAGFNEANSDSVLAEIHRLGLNLEEEYKVRGWIGWRVRNEPG